MFTIVLHQNSESRKPDQNAIKSQQRPNLLFTSSDHLPSPVESPKKVSMLNKINAVKYDDEVSSKYSFSPKESHKTIY